MKGNRVMTNILDSFRRLFKHRKHQRYFAKSDTFVIISSGKGDGQQKVQLIDISHGGMAFIYQGSQSDLDKHGILKLLTKTPSGAEINFDTVFDVPVSGNAQSPEQLRQRGVEFKWMGSFALADLKDFINEIKLCEK